MKPLFWGLLSMVSFLAFSASAANLQYSVASQTDISNLQKVREVRPVLLNFLYRGGGPGGTVLLPPAATTSLCKAGFSSAIYLYDDKSPSQQPVQCQDADGKTNQLRYHMTSFRDVRSIFSEIHNAITSNSGPVYIHCWNGWHASGEVAAKALMQFCDWSGNEAAQYWEDNIGDRGNIPKYGSIKRRVADFKPFSDLRLSQQVQDQVCPKRH
jgi:hypothetical protein